VLRNYDVSLKIRPIVPSFLLVKNGWQADNVSSLQAITDIPCIAFVDELVEAYPNAKVVLTTRDVDSWLSSMNRSFYTVLGWPSLPILATLDRVCGDVFLQ
jgi:hypothetical protein